MEKTEKNKCVPGKVVENEVLLQVGGQLEQGLSCPHHVGGSNLNMKNFSILEAILSRLFQAAKLNKADKI
jgi:hypothetical protein